MAEVSEDFEVELSSEDSPTGILNDAADLGLFEKDHNADVSLEGLEDVNLDDVLNDSDEFDGESDEGEIDLDMDEIGDLVEDLKLEVQDDDESGTSGEGEADMVFEAEETEDEINGSVESLLDELGDDSEEVVVSDTSSEDDDSGKAEEVSETEESEQTEEDGGSGETPDQSSAEPESTDEGEESSGEDAGDSESSDVLDMLHDPEIPDEGEATDSEDMELGMDALDETKDDEVTDLDLEETETTEEVSEEVGKE
ncbi:MAG TPA: flagellar motor switch protein FliN, partial [Deltaproteobacteria bacterium]|nr:flagellar motor switch protein FliN [Deltaproteobacteria bacterium]